MRSFARFAVLVSAVLLMASLCACSNPAETSVSSESTYVTSSQTTSITETSTETTAETTSETTETTSSETSSSEKPTETQAKLNTANGKFNYVLKNKSWKYDGEMYYHKYKDGTTVYYDKETKSYFLIDSKGQGWYYDSDIKDFVKDE